MSQTKERRSEFARRFVAEGRAEDVLAVLAARGLDASEELRARVLAVRDLGELDVLLRRAVTVDPPENLFDVQS